MEQHSMAVKVMAIEAGDSWLGDWRSFLEETRGQGTISAYLQDLRHFMAWFEKVNGQAFGPELMNSRDCRDYRTWCLEVAHCKPSTWNRRRSTLSVLHGWIREQGIALFDFNRLIKNAPKKKQAPRWLSQAEERRLMRQVELNVLGANTPQRKLRALRDQALVALMRFAGLRVEECANLAVADIQISERKGLVIVRFGKRENSREIPLSSTVREALRAYSASVTRGPESGEWTAFFVDEHGQGLTTRAIQKRVELLADQTGIKGLSCHALRHTCAKSILDAGRPLTEVQQVLGHEKLETTARYVQPGQDDLAEAVEMGELGRAVQSVSVRYQ